MSSPSFETTAAIRFGYGLSRTQSPPSDAGQMLSRLQQPDGITARFAIPSFDERALEERHLGEKRRARRNNEDGAQEAYKEAVQMAKRGALRDLRRAVLRAMESEDGFRERLVRFWADHFTVRASSQLRYVVSGYVEDAIRPNITGKFSTLLRAAAIHPAMLFYLDQYRSFGPNSAIGLRNDRGLNENLAREILELHTLGVGSAYTQMDVREFAELLTGLYYSFHQGFSYKVRAAEPGHEAVLGKLYGGRKENIKYIHEALDDLARHPDTARHIARKLATHFVADQPDPGLVQHLTAAFTDSDGDLMQVYAALLEHPAAWQGFGAKAKQPFDFIVSALRALGTDPERIDKMAAGPTRQYLKAPMQTMGQAYQAPPGPDGWPEEIGDWITSQGLAARVQWSLIAIQDLGPVEEPQQFARTALGEVADEALLRTVGRAESRAEGMALVLASPEFNRR